MPFNIAPAHPLLAGLNQVASARLFLHADGDSSRVAPFLEPGAVDALGFCAALGATVKGVWLVHAPDTPEPVGMAMVTEEGPGKAGDPEKRLEVINVFVHPSMQGQGIGNALIERVLAAHPAVCGHYTLDSIALYERWGIPDALDAVFKLKGKYDPVMTRSFHAMLHRQRQQDNGAMEKGEAGTYGRVLPYRTAALPSPVPAGPRLRSSR